MQLTTILPTLMAIVTIGAGSVLGRSNKVRETRQIDRYICDYREFGETGCFEKNWGIGTLTESNLNTCYIFYDDVKAVNLTRIIDGCSCMFLSRFIMDLNAKELTNYLI